MDKKKSTFYLRKVTELFFYTCLNSCQITPPPLELTMIIQNHLVFYCIEVHNLLKKKKKKVISHIPFWVFPLTNKQKLKLSC